MNQRLAMVSLDLAYPQLQAVTQLLTQVGGRTTKLPGAARKPFEFQPITARAAVRKAIDPYHCDQADDYRCQLGTAQIPGDLDRLQHRRHARNSPDAHPRVYQ